MVGKKKQMNQDEDMEINLPATSSEDHIGDVETLQQTLDRSEGESIWNTDVEFNPELADETLSEGAPLTSVIADTVIEQGDVSMSKGTTFSAETGGDYAGLDEALDDKVVDRLIQSRDHLLVPINVQALVVPPAKPSHLESKNRKENEKQQAVSISRDEDKKVFPKMAKLETSLRSNDGSDVEETDKANLEFDLPGPFDYHSSNPSSSGHPTGIHLFWSMPRALLNGKMKAKTTLSSEFSGIKVDASGYFDPKELIPEIFIPCDPEYSHPITFKEAVEKRIEFTTEDNSTIKTMNDIFDYFYLPDLWVVVRTDSQNNIKSWVIDSLNLEVTPLADFVHSKRKPNVSELTAVGPNGGSLYWTATYDNMKNRFGFHDLPEANEVGPFDYFVCGWYSQKSLDPVYMDETTPEEDWFAFIRDDLRWRVKRSDIDDDIYFDPNQIIHGMPGVIG